MRPVRALLMALMVGSLSIGASCDGEGREDQGSEGDSSGGSSSETGGSTERIRKLEPVDVSGLTDSQRERWVDLVNDQLSPCGDPVSVAKCVADERDCSSCVPAARYLVRLVRQGHARGDIEKWYRLRYSDDKKVELSTEDSPVLGAPMAPVTIVEFSDFECPFCAAARPMLERIVRESDGKVRLVFKHYPLDQHTHARKAARAAIAAGEQGKFWEMHDKLFENQKQLSKPDLIRYAKELGLDVEPFRKAMKSEETKKRIEADKAEGERVGVKGTPTVFVNGRRFEEPLRSLPAYIEEELDQ
jgi:protein-disulfide isomerase